MGKTVSFKGELAGAFVGAMRGEQPKSEEDELMQLVMLCVAYKSTPKKAVEVLRDYMSEIKDELKARREEDLRVANELHVPLSEPGSDLARAMTAYRLARYDIDKLTKAHGELILRTQQLERIQQIRARRGDVELWSYVLADGEDNGIVHLDSHGFFGAISTFGNYAFWWDAPGDCFRTFLLRSDDYYISNKLEHQFNGRVRQDQKVRLKGFMQHLFPLLRAQLREQLEAEVHLPPTPPPEK